MTNMCCSYIWVIKQGELKDVGSLIKIVRDLNCKLHRDKSLGLTQEGFITEKFIVYADKEEILSEFMQQIKQNTIFIEWNWEECNVDSYMEDGIEAAEPWSLSPLLNSWSLKGEQNAMLQEKRKSS